MSTHKKGLQFLVDVWHAFDRDWIIKQICYSVWMVCGQFRLGVSEFRVLQRICYTNKIIDFILNTAVPKGNKYSLRINSMFDQVLGALFKQCKKFYIQGYLWFCFSESIEGKICLTTTTIITTYIISASNG